MSATLANRLYENDFYGWTQLQVNALREGKIQDLDIGNLIEEIESMGKSEQRELRSRLEVLLMHLLKWRFQPERKIVSWDLSIKEQRIRINENLAENPSLKSEIPETYVSAYRFAIFGANQETQLHIKTFSPKCPWTVAQVMDADFWPDPPEASVLAPAA